MKPALIAIAAMFAAGFAAPVQVPTDGTMHYRDSARLDQTQVVFIVGDSGE